MPVIHDSKLPLLKAWPRPHRISITVAELAPDTLALIASGNSRGEIGLTSQPPVGCYKIINIYVDEYGKLVVKWSDTPQGA
jgi:hypothetical protein